MTSVGRYLTCYSTDPPPNQDILINGSFAFELLVFLFCSCACPRGEERRERHACLPTPTQRQRQLNRGPEDNVYGTQTNGAVAVCQPKLAWFADLQTTFVEKWEVLGVDGGELGTRTPQNLMDSLHAALRPLQWTPAAGGKGKLENGLGSLSKQVGFVGVC